MGQALRAIVAVYTARSADAVPQDEVLAFPWASMGFQHVQKVRTALAEKYSPASANKILSALRGVIHAAFRLGQMGGEEYQRAADVEAVKGTSAPRGRALKSGEITALFAACDPTTAQGTRDAALLAVLYGAGLRRSEAVALDLGDYDPETGVLTVRSGKGRKARTGHATNGAKAALDAWLAKRGSDAGPFFLPIHRGGSIRDRRMTDQSVLSILDRIRRKAKVRPFSPHDLRRSFISDLLDRGADIATVQRMAGHANIQTTARYDRRGEEAQRKAAELLYVPFGA
jgi:integrase